MPASHDLAAAFRALSAGALVGLVAQHVVQGRVVFPGAAYIELARAACCTRAGALDDGARLRGVVFVLPLALGGAGGATRSHQLECALDDSGGTFEVRSGEAAAGEAVGILTHCAGAARPAAAAGRAWEAGAGAARRGGCERAVSAGAQYDGFDAAGLEYGPVYRALERTHAAGDAPSVMQAGRWRTQHGAAARLRSTARPRRVAVHPAELDGALQLGGALAPVGPAADGAAATRLPFGVDESLVRRGAGEAWAVRGHAFAPLTPRCHWSVEACAERFSPRLTSRVADHRDAGRRRDAGPSRSPNCIPAHAARRLQDADTGCC